PSEPAPAETARQGFKVPRARSEPFPNATESAREIEFLTLPLRRVGVAATREIISRAARSDRPLYARNQHLQPCKNRHGADPAPRLSSRKRDPAGVSRHSLRTRRYL